MNIKDIPWFYFLTASLMDNEVFHAFPLENRKSYIVYYNNVIYVTKK